MKYLKPYKLFENTSSMKDDVNDMLLELQDAGMSVEFNNVKIDGLTYEFVISKPVKEIDINRRDLDMFDTSHLLLWKDVKEVVKRITGYVYDNGGKIRFFSDGIEWGVSDSRDFMDQFEGADYISQRRLRLLITEGRTNELIGWKDIPEKGRPYRKLKVEKSQEGYYRCDFRCELGKGNALVVGNGGVTISQGVVLKDDEKYIAGIGCTPMGKGVGRQFLSELFDYFKVNKFYLSSSSNHPVWNKMATKLSSIKEPGLDMTLYSLTKDQLNKDIKESISVPNQLEDI